MVSLRLVPLFLVTAVRAAPFLTERDLNSTKWTPDHILQPHEVILYGEGRMEVVHESVYHALLASEGISLEAPELDETFVNSTHPFVSLRTKDTESGLQSRQSCGNTNAVVVDTTQNFVDWDVQMSPVVIGVGSGIDVYVSSGYSVTNSVGVSGGIDLTFVKDRLGASFGVDFSRSWTTQTAYQIKGTVPAGYSGVMITKPYKTRRYGRVLQGCIGSQTQTGTFMADSYKEGSYNGVRWVSGAITLCMKKQYPLSRCNGAGNFI